MMTLMMKSERGLPSFMAVIKVSIMKVEGGACFYVLGL